MIAIPWLLAATVAQMPTFEASVETVYLDVLVDDRNAAVLGLKATDFEVFDNGVPQAVRLEDTAHAKLTVLLVLDVSSSVQGERLDRLREACRAILLSIGGTDEVGLLTFSQEVSLRVPPSLDRHALENALDHLQGRGGTALYDALYAGLGLPLGPGRSLVLAFTDGMDNYSWLDSAAVRAAAEDTDDVLHVVGIVSTGKAVVGFGPRPLFVKNLEDIAQATGGKFWNASSADHLGDAFRQVLEEMRSRYLLAYEPKGVGGAGRHRLEVKLRGKKGTVHARHGYFVGPVRISESPTPEVIPSPTPQ